MLLQLCTMAMAQCNNAAWVPVPIIYPENWLPVVANSRPFAQRAHSARCTLRHSTTIAHGQGDRQQWKRGDAMRRTVLNIQPLEQISRTTRLTSS